MRSALGSTTCPTLGGWLVTPPPLSAFNGIHSLRVQLLVPPHCPGQVQCSTPPLLSVLDYSLLFMLFSFFVGWGEAVLDYFPRQWVGESHVVCDAHLLILQIHASSFETSWWEKLCGVGRNGAVWGGFPQVRGPGCHRAQF
jgi:hypothetical protein